MIEYRKVMNRSLSVVACQYWEKGEREAILQYCDGVFFAEPLFISRFGRGVAIHYNWTDPRQDPQRAVEYFNVHPESFDAIRDEYLRLCDVIRALSVQRQPSLQELFDTLVLLWPGLVFAAMLGKWETSVLNPTVRQACFDLRERTDKVFYDADAVLEAGILAKIGADRAADAEFLTIEEIISGSYPDRAVIDQRKKGFMYFKGVMQSPESISDVVRSLGIEIVEEVVADAVEIRGQSASIGVVRGSVKVLFEKGQLGRVQKGDILVAGMTTPDFMPAIRRAGALVTDEGGITCHAAIVARELGTPCVIGTKIATKVLHDGDVVEVDATNGMVKVISRA